MILDKEMCYLLGYLWADGHIGKDCVTLEIVEEDGVSVKGIIEKSGLDFRITTRKRKNSIRKQMCFDLRFRGVGSKDFHNFLISSGYDNKTGSHYQILEKIPENLKHYWVRGFFDGDGCINVTEKDEKYRSSRLYFYGDIKQEWECIFDLFKKIDLKYTYQTVSRKNGLHLSSFVGVYNRIDVIKFFNFLYPECLFDIGLKRKYDKFMVVKKYENIGIRGRINMGCEQHKVFT